MAIVLLVQLDMIWKPRKELYLRWHFQLTISPTYIQVLSMLRCIIDSLQFSRTKVKLLKSFNEYHLVESEEQQERENGWHKSPQNGTHKTSYAIVEEQHVRKPVKQAPAMLRRTVNPFQISGGKWLYTHAYVNWRVFYGNEASFLVLKEYVATYDGLQQQCQLCPHQRNTAQKINVIKS